ncbi:MAG: hypothetical protein AB7G75_10395 [Candidatus Binatia bacterium]
MIEEFIADPISYMRRREREYSERRYLRNAHKKALATRRIDIYANMWTTDINGSVRRISDPARRAFFLTKLIELEVENDIRHRSRGRIVDEKQIRIIASRKYKRVRLKTVPTIPKGNFLVRYSKKEYIEKAFVEGSIRIAPAASYADSSLNAAQFDEELRHFSVTPDKQLLFKVYGSDTPGGPERELPVTPLEFFQYMEVQNFYVLCCAASFDCRMFHDFEADAAIIIFDPDTFITRINSAVLNHVQSQLKHGKINYYDPYLVERSQLVPGFFKHFRYAYQDEYRLIWEVSPQILLQPFFVNIGSMYDVADFVELR